MGAESFEEPMGESSMIPATSQGQQASSPVERYSSMTPRRSHSEPLQVSTFVKEFEQDWSLLIEPTLKQTKQDADVMSEATSERTGASGEEEPIDTSASQ